MKRGKDDYSDLDGFDRKARKSKKGKRPAMRDEELEFQSWMNRPSDVADYFDDDDDDAEVKDRN